MNKKGFITQIALILIAIAVIIILIFLWPILGPGNLSSSYLTYPSNYQFNSNSIEVFYSEQTSVGGSYEIYYAEITPEKFQPYVSRLLPSCSMQGDLYQKRDGDYVFKNFYSHEGSSSLSGGSQLKCRIDDDFEGMEAGGNVRFKNIKVIWTFSGSPPYVPPPVVEEETQIETPPVYVSTSSSPAVQKFDNWFYRLWNKIKLWFGF